MSDQAKLCISLLVITVLDLLFIVYGYHHGNMHLFKTLTNAAEIWK